MKKVLFIATVESHIIRFHLPYLKRFQDEGYEVHVACKGTSKIKYCDVKHDVPFERFPFRLKNVGSFFMLRTIMAENNFDLIHCHTPVGGAIGRLAAMKSRKQRQTKVLYTAHGFHFCKGGPLVDWLTFYPVEKILSYVTDCLITINDEDFQLAQKKFKAKKICKIKSIGVDIERFGRSFADDERIKLRQEENIEANDFVLLYVADLSKRKNQGFLIKEMVELKRRIPHIKLLLAGPDTAGGLYQEMCRQLQVEQQVMFLGERNNIPELLALADISVTSSKREGLAINIVEALAAGKCVMASNVRGNQDLIVDGETGFLFSLNENEKFSDIILRLYQNAQLREEIALRGKLTASAYQVQSALEEMESIYKTY